MPPPNPFKSFSKPKTAKGFADFSGKRQRKPEYEQPAVEKAKAPVLPERERDLANVLGDDNLAKRVISLQERHPYGTVPEMLAMDWLDKNLAEYVFQAKVNGGFRSGGLVPDFLVKHNGQGTALLIQGDYWHNLPGKKQKDATDKLRLRGSYTSGVEVKQVVFIWESRMMRSKDERDSVMAAALQGVELPP